MNRIQKHNLRVAVIILIAIALLTWLGVRNSPDSIHNPDNQPFVLEVAFNERITEDEVTQDQFNARYGTTIRTITFKK